MDKEMQEAGVRRILRQVRQVEIRSRRAVDEALAGAYHSVFKGRGMEFAEVREYFPGDDVRSIDWNVTARLGHPFVKVFEEERELTMMLVVDLSASGDFGSVAQSKRERAAELACVLALSATRNNDKVGLLLFTDQVEYYLPARKGRQHVLRVVRDILFFEPKGRGTNIPGALNTINRLQKRKAIVFLISDFLTDETLAWIRPATRGQGELERSLRLTNRRHDLVCVECHDPRESLLPDVGLVTLEDAESGELVEIDTSDRMIRQLYAHQNASRRERLTQMFRQAGVDTFPISTDASYMSALRGFFRQRERRR